MELLEPDLQVDAVDPEVDEVDLAEVPLLEGLRLVLPVACQRVVSRVTVAADNPDPEPRNCCNDGAKSNESEPPKPVQDVPAVPSEPEPPMPDVDAELAAMAAIPLRWAD